MILVGRGSCGGSGSFPRPASATPARMKAATALFGRGKSTAADPPVAAKPEKKTGLFGRLGAGTTKEAVRQQQTIRGSGKQVRARPWPAQTLRHPKTSAGQSRP